MFAAAGDQAEIPKGARRFDRRYDVETASASSLYWH